MLHTIDAHLDEGWFCRRGRGVGRGASAGRGSAGPTIESFFGSGNSTGGAGAAQRVRGSGAVPTSAHAQQQHTGLPPLDAQLQSHMPQGPAHSHAPDVQLDYNSTQQQQQQQQFHAQPPGLHFDGFDAQLDYNNTQQQQQQFLAQPPGLHFNGFDTQLGCNAMPQMQQQSHAQPPGLLDDDSLVQFNCGSVHRMRGSAGGTRMAGGRSATTVQTRTEDPDDEWEDVLLVLDSQTKSDTLADALASGTAWQKYVKRTAATFNMPAYQVVVVRGMLSAEQRNASRKLSSLHLG